jgi:recombination protein RecA
MARDDLIEATVKAFVKKFGDGTACTLTKMFAPENVKGFVPTGNLAIDWVIGRPGFPLGRISEIAGPFSSGKSSIVAQAIGAAQKQGIVCVLADTEHSYDSSWSTRFGVDPEHLILLQPQHLEALFDEIHFIIEVVKEGKDPTPMFIVADSVSATPASAELEMEDSTGSQARGLHARIISQGLRKLSNLIWNERVALLFISQLKDNPGIMYGTNKSKIGGHAIDFHAGLLLETRKLAQKKGDGETEKIIGQTIQVHSTKNKFVPPFRTRTFDLFFDSGIRPKEIALSFLSDPELLGRVKAGGGWYEYGGQKYRKEQLAELLDESIVAEIYQSLGLTQTPVQTATTTPTVDQAAKVAKVKKETLPLIVFDSLDDSAAVVASLPAAQLVGVDVAKPDPEATVIVHVENSKVTPPPVKLEGVVSIKDL